MPYVLELSEKQLNVKWKCNLVRSCWQFHLLLLRQTNEFAQHDTINKLMFKSYIYRSNSKQMSSVTLKIFFESVVREIILWKGKKVPECEIIMILISRGVFALALTCSFLAIAYAKILSISTWSNVQYTFELLKDSAVWSDARFFYRR